MTLKEYIISSDVNKRHSVRDSINAR